jgi:phosphatidylinositol alpha-1,6-mannosyltransferase
MRLPTRKLQLFQTLVLTEHFLPETGGSIRWLLNTYSRLDSKKVICVAPQGVRTAEVDRRLPFRVDRIPMALPDWDPTVLASLWRYAYVIWYVYDKCRKHRIQQIHCAKVLPEGLVAWCLHGLTGIPYLVYAHGEEILISGTSHRLSWFLPKIYGRAAVIIANAANTKRLLESIGVPFTKIHIIHPGVDVSAFRIGNEAVRCIRQRHRLGTAPVLLTVGRLQQRKGQDMVIQALPKIKQCLPAVKYVIVGDGGERSRFEALAHTVGVAESVVFAGEVTDEELPAYYAACEVFIMPNRQLGPDIEGFGIVYLEAGAVGKPVIGGISGGTEDAIIEGVTGLRVDGASVDAIAKAALFLLTEPEKAKAMGENGRRRVEREFSWESVVQRTAILSASMHANQA